jgi:hypothetical protein
MFKNAAIGITCFLLGLLGGMGAISHSSDVRFEMGAGVARHSLAPEGSWWYDGFDVKTKLTTSSYSFGVAWNPLHSGRWSYGARLGYANLGTVQSWNSFPIFEDFTEKDARVNANCDRETLHGCVGAYNGQGKSSGYYLGPVVERKVGDLVLGGELGAFRYKSSWTADSVRAVEPNGDPWCTFGGDWDYARGHHATSYVGAHARWEWVHVSVRRYSNIRASRTDVHKDFVGMTSGPVWTMQIGLSIPLR